MHEFLPDNFDLLHSDFRCNETFTGDLDVYLIDRFLLDFRFFVKITHSAMLNFSHFLLSFLHIGSGSDWLENILP